ncbi:MAG TPA: HupE/UreJ family protein [Vicinamibacterales bacterium]|nr:HupE/UreJ family protein [Vicinamibacterales bacterium]
MPRLAAFLLCALSAPPAWAHPAPFSYLDVVFRDGGIDGTLVVHVIDVAHDLGIAPPERLLENAVASAERQRIGELLAPRFLLRAGRRLTPQWQSLEVLREEQALRLRFRIPGESPGALTIDTNLFPYDRNHQTFVNIYEDGELRQQKIFNADAPEYTYYLGTTQGAIEVMKTFIPSGVHHILIGPDHILFLVGLLLLGGTWLSLVKIVTAFTIGHSVTLSLAALNLLSPPASVVEPAIALSIVFVGADNLVRGDGRDVRAWAAGVFGLVHGFGFANVLREFGLPDEALGWSLFSFNVGVEIGQLAVVLLVASALAAIRRRSAALGARVALAGSIVVIGAGTYWFIKRVFFPGSV